MEEDAQDMLAEGLRRAPDCYALHRAYNDRLSARWGGNHQGQLEHARHVASAAQNGSLAAALPINALYFHLRISCSSIRTRRP